MEKVLVSLGGISLIVFVYWFFFGKKEVIVVASGKIDILVEGGYKPKVIKVKRGERTTLSLLRKDPNPCLEEFILSDFKIKKYLPLGKAVNIEIKPDKAGTFSFHCGMNMFHGKIIVE